MCAYARMWNSVCVCVRARSMQLYFRFSRFFSFSFVIKRNAPLRQLVSRGDASVLILIAMLCLQLRVCAKESEKKMMIKV